MRNDRSGVFCMKSKETRTTRVLEPLEATVAKLGSQMSLVIDGYNESE